jgi:hypothetical protein
MKHLLHLAPILVCLASCQSTPTTPEVASAAAPTPTEQKQATTELPKSVNDNSEHIEWSMLTVNGKPVKELTTSQLIRQFGRPDKIEKGAIECGAMLSSLNKMDSPEGDAWFYGKTMYEVNGKDAVLGSFEVTSGKFRGKLGPLLLNQHTTLEDVRRVFPVSAKQADAPSTGRPEGEEMSLPFYYKGEMMDDCLLLFFKKGRLQSVDFFSPC